MAEDETSIQAIHRLYYEVVETKSKLRTVRDELKDVAEQNDDWRELQDEIKELANKKATAKKMLEADKDYQVIHSEQAELKFKLKDLLEIISHHLMLYRDETGADHVEDPEGEARQIITQAKLGKPDPLLVNSGKTQSKKPIPGQVTMESQLDGYGKPGGASTNGRKYEISDGKSKVTIDGDGIHSDANKNDKKSAPKEKLSDISKWPAKNKAARAKEES